MELEISRHHFDLKGKKAEKLVQDLAVKSFLTDWCYPNPKLPDGKELCDLLVVFDDITILCQIKDLKLDENGRYKPADVEKNLKQLMGARRQLFDLKTPIEIENPRRRKERFDPHGIREAYLISALLGEGEELFSFGESIKAYTIHVFTRAFTEIVLNELDTISDFVDYLRTKEAFLKKDKRLTILGGEEELLASYLINGRSFGKLESADLIMMDGTIWEGLEKNPQYVAKKEADKISYYWDSIINRAHQGGPEYEVMARELARSNRFQRRVLAQAFYNAHIEADQCDYDMFRRMMVVEGTTYCFLFMDDADPRERRKSMLGAMCWVARGQNKENKKVIGIATEKKIRPVSSYDFCLLEIPEWTAEYQKHMERLQGETGIFVNPRITRTQEDEYPKNRLWR